MNEQKERISKELYDFLFPKNLEPINPPSIGTGRCVYFIRSGDYIKIGSSVNIRKRMKSLQIGNPIKLKLIYYNNKLSEYLMHNQFSSDYIHGEWFHYSEDIKNFIIKNKLKYEKR